MGGTGVYVGGAAEAVGSGPRGDSVAVTLAVGVADGGGEGGSELAGAEAIAEGDAGTGVSVGSSVDALDVIRVDSGVETVPAEGRHAASKVPIAARPRLTKRRREIRSNTLPPRSRPISSSHLEFIYPPISPELRSARHLESGPLTSVPSPQQVPTVGLSPAPGHARQSQTRPCGGPIHRDPRLCQCWLPVPPAAVLAPSYT